MKRTRLWIVIGALLLWPSTARAAEGWWGWLEELSGPGYFTGPMYSMPLVCWLDGKPVSCRLFQRQTGERNQIYNRSLVVTAGWMTSGSRARLKDLVVSGNDSPSNHRRIVAIPVNATLMFRPHRSIDIGPGAGVLFFTGQDVNAHARIVLIPVSASWKFLLTSDKWQNSSLRRLLGLELQTSYITKGFTGRDFGSTTSTYTSKPEMRATVGISLDFGEWR